ncbi:vitamin B12 transporter [Geobacter argillaceus]|uniref:Vitamin B12 transporter n=1 Tax=Geobacter argillaceus TaxID=345631 RepID=A0A562VQ07_9BACT|nr:vitamin B12 transporter [Geobacter argillaceus]
MMHSLSAYRLTCFILKELILRRNFPQILVIVLLVLLGRVTTSWGISLDEADSIALLTGEPEQTVSTGRYPRPASKIAENITVITADDIARINAHTLADVLQTVPGIQLDQLQTPGSWTFFSIQGALSRHIQVLIDGVPQNFLSVENTGDTGLIPVQQIERIEIVKGAASTAWGQALGGVVNVITKSPDPDRAVGGTASASYGERFTTDLRGELTGTVNRFGYYLNGGNLHSDGLVPGNRINFNHASGKVVYELPNAGNITFDLDFRDSFRGLEDSVVIDGHDSNEQRQSHSFLNFNYPVTDRLMLEMMGWLSRKESETKWGFLSSPALLTDNKARQSARGANLRLTWGDQLTNLAAGLEYEHDSLTNSEPINQFPTENFKRSLDRLGIYLNGGISFGPLTLLPGVRFDHTGLDDDALSYSLGVTYRLTEKTLARAYAGRGYSFPVTTTLRNRLQQVWTVQTGVETSEIPYLWLKGTLFYNDTWKIEDPDFSTDQPTINLREQIKQGFELEARTFPLYGFVLTGGYTLTDARDRETKNRLEKVPVQGAKLALNYDNDKMGLRGALTGNYVWWNAPAFANGKYSAIIWDLHLTHKLCPKTDLSPELFISVHNLFSGSQYGNSLYPNPPRWFEGGVRFRF